jgi:hypothetical protein
MSQQSSVEFSESQSGGHPRELLARLYREIGMSAVASALEIPYLQDDETAAPGYVWEPLGEDIAA